MSAKATSPTTRSRKPWIILFSIVAALIIMGIMASNGGFSLPGFSFGGGSDGSNSAPQSTCLGGEFLVNAGEEIQTVRGMDLATGFGCAYDIRFTGAYAILTPTANGRYREFRNMSGWCGLPPGGLVRIRGFKDNAVITFRFVGLIRKRSDC